MNVDMKLMVKYVVQNKNGITNNKCQCECKKPIKHCAYKEDYPWNPSIGTCECEKYCEIG